MVNIGEEYVKIEFKAVMKLKLEYFKWFEGRMKGIVKDNRGFLKMKQRQLNSSEGGNEADSSLDSVIQVP
jgi:hypothetical protein